MWELTIQTVTLAAVLAILGLCSYLFVGYIRLLRCYKQAKTLLLQLLRAARKMECDDLIDQLLNERESAGGRCTTLEKQESAGATELCTTPEKIVVAS